MKACRWMLGEAAMQIATGRLLTMHAAWHARPGRIARRRKWRWPRSLSPTLLHKAIATSIQLCGARGYSKDTLLGMDVPLRAARRRLVDGASEVHKMVLAKHFMNDGRDFWQWG